MGYPDNVPNGHLRRLYRLRKKRALRNYSVAYRFLDMSAESLVPRSSRDVKVVGPQLVLVTKNH